MVAKIQIRLMLQNWRNLSYMTGNLQLIWQKEPIKAKDILLICICLACDMLPESVRMSNWPELDPGLWARLIRATQGYQQNSSLLTLAPPALEWVSECYWRFRPVRHLKVSCRVKLRWATESILDRNALILKMVVHGHKMQSSLLHKSVNWSQEKIYRVSQKFYISEALP